MRMLVPHPGARFYIFRRWLRCTGTRLTARDKAFLYQVRDPPPVHIMYPCVHMTSDKHELVPSSLREYELQIFYSGFGVLYVRTCSI